MMLWDGFGVGKLGSGWGATHEWKEEVAIRLWILRNPLLGCPYGVVESML